jgi:hypothetical protein
VLRVVSCCIELGCFLKVHLGGNSPHHLTMHDDGRPQVRLERNIRIFLQNGRQYKLVRFMLYRSRKEIA